MSKQTLLVAFGLLILGVSGALAEAVSVDGVFGLAPVPDGTSLAVWVPLESDESISGVSWYNNDGTVAFPELLAVAGSPDYPSVLNEAVVVGEGVAGATLGWSEFVFETPLASATPGLFLVFRLPPGGDFVDEGEGAGLGYHEGDGQIRCWLSSTAGQWDMLNPEYQMAVKPIMNANKSGAVLVLGTPGSLSPSEDGGEIPEVLVAGMSVAPNPFNPQTEVRFTLPHSAQVNLSIYDVRGRKVTTLISSEMTAGHHAIAWDGRNGKGRPQASGVYLALLEAGPIRLTRRMTLVQ